MIRDRKWKAKKYLQRENTKKIINDKYKVGEENEEKDILRKKKKLYNKNLWIYNVKLIKGNFFVNNTKNDNIKYDNRSCFFNQILSDFPDIFKKKKVAVDIGARVGEWSRLFGMYFNKVISFEGRKKWCDSFTKNVIMKNVVLYKHAIGNEESYSKMNGNSIVDISKDYKNCEDIIKIGKLDKFNIKEIDFLKIDTDGHELNVLKGGKSTILKTKPIILIECQIKNKGDPYPLHYKYLENLGAKILKKYGDRKYYIHDILCGWG